MGVITILHHTPIGILSIWEKICPQWIRRKALNFVMDHIQLEDESTNFICIGPVNKTINTLSVWYHEGESERFKKHVDRLYDYLWLAEDGMKMQVCNKHITKIY